MIFDERYTAKQIRQFAGEINNVAPEIREDFASMFNGTESDDFYAGLIAGLANAVAIAQGGQAAFLPIVLALVADRVEQKEIA
jgi:hypothetical protein